MHSCYSSRPPDSLTGFPISFRVMISFLIKPDTDDHFSREEKEWGASFIGTTRECKGCSSLSLRQIKLQSHRTTCMLTTGCRPIKLQLKAVRVMRSLSLSRPSADRRRVRRVSESCVLRPSAWRCSILFPFNRASFCRKAQGRVWRPERSDCWYCFQSPS